MLHVIVYILMYMYSSLASERARRRMIMTTDEYPVPGPAVLQYWYDAKVQYDINNILFSWLSIVHFSTKSGHALC
jgi:hypothetical protein